MRFISCYAKILYDKSLLEELEKVNFAPYEIRDFYAIGLHQNLHNEINIYSQYRI
jgi:hypothetical protein